MKSLATIDDGVTKDEFCLGAISGLHPLGNLGEEILPLHEGSGPVDAVKRFGRCGEQEAGEDQGEDNVVEV